MRASQRSRREKKNRRRPKLLFFFFGRSDYSSLSLKLVPFAPPPLGIALVSHIDSRKSNCLDSTRCRNKREGERRSRIGQDVLFVRSSPSASSAAAFAPGFGLALQEVDGQHRRPPREQSVGLIGGAGERQLRVFGTNHKHPVARFQKDEKTKTTLDLNLLFWKISSSFPLLSLSRRSALNHPSVNLKTTKK